MSKYPDTRLNQRPMIKHSSFHHVVSYAHVPQTVVIDDQNSYMEGQKSATIKKTPQTCQFSQETIMLVYTLYQYSFLQGHYTIYAYIRGQQQDLSTRESDHRCEAEVNITFDGLLILTLAGNKCTYFLLYIYVFSSNFV